MANATRRVLDDWALLVLRVVPGVLLFYGHGLPKLMNYGERASRFSDPIGLGPEAGFALVVLTETLAAALVAVGLLTRLATIPLIAFFLIAALIQHAHDPFPKRELPLLFAAPYVALLLTGAGRFSIDGWLGSRRAR